MRVVPIALVVSSLAVAGCAVAGKRAAIGMQESVRESQAAAGEGSGEGSPSQVAGQRAVRGAAQELVSPETTREIGVAVDAGVSRGLYRLHQEFASGEGRLARDLDATAERTSAAAMRGVHVELDKLVGDALGDCNGLDRRACLRREIHALGAEASAGFMDGFLGSHAWTLALIFFLSGVAVALVVRVAWDHFGDRFRHIGRNARA
jgi:hypothetical protein